MTSNERKNSDTAHFGENSLQNNLNSIGHDEDKEDKIFRSIGSSIPNSFTYNTKSDHISRVAGGGSAEMDENRLLETLEKQISQMDSHQSQQSDNNNKETPVFDFPKKMKKLEISNIIDE